MAFGLTPEVLDMIELTMKFWVEEDVMFIQLLLNLAFLSYKVRL